MQLREEEEKMGHSRVGMGLICTEKWKPWKSIELMQEHRMSRATKSLIFTVHVRVCLCASLCPCAHVSDFLSTAVLNCRGGGGGAVTWG